MSIETCELQDIGKMVKDLSHDPRCRALILDRESHCDCAHKEITDLVDQIIEREEKDD